MVVRNISRTLFLLFALSISLLSCKPSNRYLSDIDTRYYRISDRTENVDTKIEDMIAPYREELSGEMDVVLIQNDQALKKQKPNSNLGSWVADILEDAASAELGAVDFAVQNYGGLRIGGIPTGDVTVGKIYELMPFENILVVQELTAAQVTQFCQKITDSGGYPVSRGLSFTMADGAPKDIKIKGKDLDPTKTYRVAVPDYIANGGSGYDFLKPIPQSSTGLNIRAAIIDWIKALAANGGSLNINNEKRIHG